MHRTSKGGTYRLDKVFPRPVGRLAIATGATTQEGYKKVEACLDRLAEPRRKRLDVLLALKRRQLTVAQVVEADAEDQINALMDSLTRSRELAPMWPAVDAWLGDKEHLGATRRRYAVSLLKLRRTGVLDAEAPVSALGTVDWAALSEQWDGSPADWNHCKRAVSCFLVEYLGGKTRRLRRIGRAHELWLTVAGDMEMKPEQERVPDLDVPTLWRVVRATPEPIQPALVTLVALGLRVGEYLRLTPEHLHPITKTVSVPGTKTAGSAAVLQVAPDLWPWVVAAVPAPVAYNWLRIYWKRALKAVGADVTLRLHDLRHLTAQLLVNSGRSEASVQTTMRHATASMTRRYARQRDRGENAEALAHALLEGVA